MSFVEFRSIATELEAMSRASRGVSQEKAGIREWMNEWIAR